MPPPSLSKIGLDEGRKHGVAKAQAPDAAVAAAVVTTAPPVVQSPLFFSDSATTEIYTLPLHDPLPIYPSQCVDVSTHADAAPVHVKDLSE